MSLNDAFTRISTAIAHAAGHATTFVLSVTIIVVWAVTGPLFQFSDTWQLIINTGTTIVTFLMVFLIQNTQNRDAKALHLKLDELIRSNTEASNKLIDLEDLSDAEITELQEVFRKLHESENENVRGMGARLHAHLGLKSDDKQ